MGQVGELSARGGSRSRPVPSPGRPASEPTSETRVQRCPNSVQGPLNLAGTFLPGILPQCVVCLLATQWRHLTTQWGTRTRCVWIHGRPQGAGGTGAVPLVVFVSGSMGHLEEKDGE